MLIPKRYFDDYLSRIMEENVLKIKFLGTGGAFESNYGNSAAIVVHSGMRFLVDCGHTVFPRLMALGLADQIDAVIITHLHDDHVGSLSTFILYHDLVLGKGRLKIYAGDALQPSLTALLAFSLGQPSLRVDFRPLAEVPGLGCIDTFGRHVPGMQTYGYYFTDGHQSIVYSGDNGDADFLVAQVIALGLPSPTIYHEVFFHFRMHAHAYYQDLMGLMTVCPIYGYHCDPLVAPADNTLKLVANYPELNY
jgi:Metallo-beta-lactamase superfamily